MFRPRIIPILLLKDKGIVKTIKFKKPNYIGDPINAVKLFNDMKADELIFLDIEATKENRSIDFNLVKKISNEAFMPIAVGGGIKDLETATNILKSGAEKVIINTSFTSKSSIVSDISKKFGRQSVVVSIDVKKNFFGRYKIFHNCGTKKFNLNLDEYISSVELQGAGEIMINSIDKDGTKSGFDFNLIDYVSRLTDIPVIGSGGASSLENMAEVYFKSPVSALAAGSLFVYHGPRNAVLINYPSDEEIREVFESEYL